MVIREGRHVKQALGPPHPVVIFLQFELGRKVLWLATAKSKNRGRMSIVHIVLFKLRASLTEQEKKEVQTWWLASTFHVMC